MHQDSLSNYFNVRKNQNLLAYFLILTAFFLRLAIILSGQINLYYDEAQYWDWSRRLDWSYYSKGPLIAYLIWFWCKIFGPTELGVRFGACLNFSLSQILIFKGLQKACELKNCPHSLLPLVALVISCSTPLFLISGLLMTTDNILVLAYFIALFCFYFFLQTENNTYLLGMICSLILGILAKYTMLFFIPLSIVVTYRTKPALTFKIIWANIIGGCIGLLPILIWNLKYDWVGLKHVLYRGNLAGQKAFKLFHLSSFPEFIGGQIGVLTPWYFGLLFWSWFHPSIKKIGNLEYRFCQTFFWPFWLFFLILSLHTKVEANWPALAYVPGLVILAYGFLTLSSNKQKLFLGLSLLIFILFHLLPFIPLPQKLDVLKRMRGYEQIGKYVYQLKQTQFKNPKQVFIFSDSYGISAELAFYTPGKPCVYCVNLGRKQNQYDLWPKPTTTYRDGIFVTKGIAKNIPLGLKKMFTSLKGPFIFHSTHKGKPGQTVSIILGYNFTGYWPSPLEKTF